MKTGSKTLTKCLTAILLAGGVMAAALADDAKPDELRAKAQQLMAKARDLKAQGALEDSQKIAEEAKKLEGEANRIAKGSGERREKPGAPEKAERPKIDQLRAKVSDLAAAGRLDEASKLKQQIAGLERPKKDQPRGDERAELEKRLQQAKAEIAELHKLGRHEEAERLQQKAHAMLGKMNPDAPRRPAEMRDREMRKPEVRVEHREFARMTEPRPPREVPPVRPGPEGEERRLQHLRVAIENLHAAGLHEPANRLAQDLERSQASVRERREPGPRGPEGSGDANRALQRQVDELRQAVRQLNERLEQLSRRER